MRNCPVFPAEQQGQPRQQNPSQFHSPPQPFQPPPRPLQPPPQQPPQPDVRPLKDRSNKPDKTCIWVKYCQYILSALIDTGSDVSIASEDIARRMGWEIHAHRTKEVSVANNDVMPAIGAAYVTLNVAGHGTKSKILIAPELEGLILASIGCKAKVVSIGISTRVESNSATENGSNFAERPISLDSIHLGHIPLRVISVHMAQILKATLFIQLNSFAVRA